MPAPLTRIKVSIVEDHDAYREHLAALIGGANGFECLGAYRSAEVALRKIPDAKPDVVLLDLELPGLWGQDLVVQLKRVLPKLEILVLTVHDEPELIFKALEAGASGYLSKPASPAEILEAIAVVHGGGSAMSSGIARLVINCFHERGRARRQLDHLTRREEEILKLVAQGYQAKEIADTLQITLPTVRTHLHNIYTKFHVRSRVEATARYLKA